MTKAKIEKILQEKFHPQQLEIIDDSAKHADHNPDAQKGGTHFSILIISKAFAGKSLLERHRMVYSVLQEEFKSGLHALAIRAETPSRP